MTLGNGEDTGQGKWTEEKINQLRELWPGKMAARDIGAILKMSKNSVIGKAYRLELGKRARGAPRAEGAPARRPRRPKLIRPKAPPEPVKIEPPVNGGLHILELEDHHCRAIIGHGADGLARYCGATKRPMLSYDGQHKTTSAGDPLFWGSFCRGHAGLYYRPITASSSSSIRRFYWK